MTRAEMLHLVREQLACELGCAPEDFSGEENVITAPILHEKRRRFSDEPFFLQMATFGGNAVLSADESLHQWLRDWVRDKEGFWLFEQHEYFKLERELRKHGYRMALTHHMFLPGPERKAPGTGPELRWLEQADIAPYYGRKELSNALCDRFHPERPDVLAVAAFRDWELMGMAGCSADTPKLWQIGVDVLPGFRGRGLGTCLVTLLKNEALRRGAIPYYGTSLSNLYSWRVALSSGFVPAWIEAEARVDRNQSFMK